MFRRNASVTYLIDSPKRIVGRSELGSGGGSSGIFPPPSDEEKASALSLDPSIVIATRSTTAVVAPALSLMLVFCGNKIVVFLREKYVNEAVLLKIELRTNKK